MRANEEALIASRWWMEEMQLYRFGVFNTSNVIDFTCPGEDGSLNAILGRSGVGKSTILDARTILSEQREDLNRASGGKRGGRSIASYVLGYVRDVENSDGSTSPYFLRRRNGEAAYGGVRIRYRSDLGESLDVAGFFFVEAGRTSDAGKFWALSPDPIELTLIDGLEGRKFTRSALLELFPTCEYLDSSKTGFIQRQRERFGTTEASEKLAHKLLVAEKAERIEDIFSSYVLPVPPTIERAEKLCGAARGWRVAEEELRLRREQKVAVDRIRERGDVYLRESAEAEDYAPLVDEDASLFRAWRKFWWTRRRGELLTELRPSVEKELRQTEATASASRAKVGEIDEALEAKKAALKAVGGDVEDLLKMRDAAESRVKEVKNNDKKVRRFLSAAGCPFPQDEAEWESLSRRLKEVESDGEAAGDMRRAAFQDVEKCRKEAEDARSALSRAREGVRLEARQVEARKAFCEALGTQVEELPYLAELFDVREGDEEWRSAVNDLLAREADKILILSDDADSDRVKIEGVAPEKLGRRAKFEFVPREEAERATFDSGWAGREGWVSSIIKVKESSPLAGWVQHRFAQGGLDAKLVGDGAFDPGEGIQVSINGQVKRGRRGAYGRGRRGGPDFIGFSDERLVAERAESLATCEGALDEAEGQENRLAARAERGRAAAMAALAIEGLSWLDVALVPAQLELERVEQELRKADERGAGRIRADIKALEEARDDALRAEGVARQQRDMAAERLRAVDGAVEKCSKAQVPEGSTAPSAKVAMLCEECFDYLKEHRRWGVSELAEEGEAEAARRAHEARCVEAARKALDGVAAARKELEDEMRIFLSRFPRAVRAEPVAEALGAFLAVDVSCTESHDRYHHIREARSGLNDFLKMVQTYEDDAEDKFRKVNTILEDKPFNSAGDPLQFSPKFLGSSAWTTFKSRVAKFGKAVDVTSEPAFEQLPESDQERLFEDGIACIMMLDSADRASASVRDPRLRLRVTAKAGEESISDTAGMNGGKREKVTAFVLAAAVYSSLGSDRAGSLTFTPLFLDEAFSLGDDESTRMSFEVLRHFGFQVVAAACDKAAGTVMRLADRTWQVVRKGGELHPAVIERSIDRIV